MDITNLALVCFVAITGVHVANAGCVEDISSDGNYLICMGGYMQFMQSQDPQNMATAMCSPEGKSTMGCMLAYFAQCPELASTMMGGAGEGSNGGGGMDFSQYLNQAGMDKMCSMRPGDEGSPGGKCAEIMACANMSGGSSHTPGKTPFSNFQDHIKELCVGTKKVLMCYDNAPKECADIVKEIVKGLPEAIKEARTYISQRCPRLPNDFYTNTCVRQQVETEAFITCATKSGQSASGGNCDQFMMGKKCVDKTVGTSCGQNYADPLSAALPLMIDDIPTSCMDRVPLGSGSGELNISLGVMLIWTSFGILSFF